jgi:hypothetical protein
VQQITSSQILSEAVLEVVPCRLSLGSERFVGELPP